MLGLNRLIRPLVFIAIAPLSQQTAAADISLHTRPSVFSEWPEHSPKRIPWRAVLVFGLLREAGDLERTHTDWGSTINHSFTLKHSHPR